MKIKAEKHLFDYVIYVNVIVFVTIFSIGAGLTCIPAILDRLYVGENALHGRFTGVTNLHSTTI